MQKDPANAFAEAIGHYLIDKCGRSEQVAAAVMKPDKTLKGCCETINSKIKSTVLKKIDQKKVKEVVEPVEDIVVFDIVDEYFGIASDGTGADAPRQAAPSGGLTISFEDFI